MDETAVIIVGAGPSGLALAAALAFHKIKSIILEKNDEICEDPRSVSINGDSLRIVQVLGITQERLLQLGQIMRCINFHRDSFSNPPFLTIDMNRDWLEHALPTGLVVLQPRLEQDLRQLVQASEYTELRLECTVTSISEVDNGMVQATYERKDGTTVQVRGKYLVGADGKRGYVRKGFLEAKGVEQQVGIHKYHATWVAANLRVNMPTPTSHPTFPLWELGYQPEELWPLFWPAGFHFCNHDKYPTASGSFGPVEEKFWRFEWELPADDVPDDLVKALADQLDRNLTLSPTQVKRNGKTISKPVRFPQDCIEVQRCAPARFNQRVVNHWFHNNVILIGDAAHVFPPFAGQGMANGIRDAFALAWRLALLCDSDLSDGHPAPKPSSRSNSILECWARERRKGVDISSTETKRNGDLLLNKSASLATLIGYGSWIVGSLAPSVRDAMIHRVFSDERGFLGTENGYFLPEDHGGRKIAQVHVQTADGSIQATDHILCKPRVVLTLLLLHPFPTTEHEAREIQLIVESQRLPPYLLSKQVIQFCQKQEEEDEASSAAAAAAAAAAAILKNIPTAKLVVADPKIIPNADQVLLPHYDPTAFRRRFSPTTRFVLLRPDLIIFSEARTTDQLQDQLRKATDMLLNQ